MEFAILATSVEANFTDGAKTTKLARSAGIKIPESSRKSDFRKKCIKKDCHFLAMQAVTSENAVRYADLGRQNKL